MTIQLPQSQGKTNATKQRKVLSVAVELPLPTVRACGFHLSAGQKPCPLLVPATATPSGDVSLLGGTAMVFWCSC
jgi:hypothetical protein